MKKLDINEEQSTWSLLLWNINVVMLEFCLSRQVNLSDVYGNVSGDAQRHPAEQEDELHYTSIRLSVNQEEALYCNFRPAKLHGRTEEEDEEDGVDYTIVKTD